MKDEQHEGPGSSGEGEDHSCLLLESLSQATEYRLLCSMPRPLQSHSRAWEGHSSLGVWEGKEGIAVPRVTKYFRIELTSTELIRPYTYLDSK